MSKHTLGRIPREVNHIFRLYENTAQLTRPQMDPAIRTFLGKSSSYYDTFSQLKLRSHSASAITFNPRDFPPVLADAVASIFSEPLTLEKLLPEQLDVENLLHPDSGGPLVSLKNKRARHFSDFQARILSNLASFYSPLEYVPEPSRQSYVWYRRLLRNTPVIFFLRQKHLLMDQASLWEQNVPLATFEEDLREIKRLHFATHSDVAKTTRNYHMTDLSTTDLFGLALLSEHLFPSEAELLSRDFWRELEPQNDELLQRIRSLQQPEVIRPGNIDLVKAYPLTETVRKLGELDDVADVGSVFPADLAYSGLHMLTIEASVLRENHVSLLNMVERSDLEIFAVRMAKSAISEKDFSSADVQGATYDQLIEHARSLAQTQGSLLKRIGEWGLVTVEENGPGTAFYFFK